MATQKGVLTRKYNNLYNTNELRLQMLKLSQYGGSLEEGREGRDEIKMKILYIAFG